MSPRRLSQRTVTMTLAVGNKIPKRKNAAGLPRVLIIQSKFIPKKPVKKVIGRNISETIVSRLICSPWRFAIAAAELCAISAPHW